MKKDNISVVLMDKLIKLNELEVAKAKILFTIFMKNSVEIIEKKINSFETNFKDQIEFYNQKFNDYEEVYNKILSKYKYQLSQIIDKYKNLYINIQLELQEAECNQKIAITNLKKSFDIKNQLLEKGDNKIINEYNKKIIACSQKKINYDIIIAECEKEIESCTANMQKRVNALFADKTSQVAVKEFTGFKKFANKIINKFTGTKKFNMYVIEPLSIEVEMLDSKLPDITDNIKQETINFVAKIKQAKDETNKIFENMMNG